MVIMKNLADNRYIMGTFLHSNYWDCMLWVLKDEVKAERDGEDVGWELK